MYINSGYELCFITSCCSRKWALSPSPKLFLRTRELEKAAEIEPRNELTAVCLWSSWVDQTAGSKSWSLELEPKPVCLVHYFWVRHGTVYSHSQRPRGSRSWLSYRLGKIGTTKVYENRRSCKLSLRRFSPICNFAAPDWLPWVSKYGVLQTNYTLPLVAKDSSYVWYIKATVIRFLLSYFNIVTSNCCHADILKLTVCLFHCDSTIFMSWLSTFLYTTSVSISCIRYGDVLILLNF